MAEGRNQHTFQQGQGGRRKGSVDKIPRSQKQALRHVYDEVWHEHPAEIKAAILRGINSKPPLSAPYLKLWSEFVIGKPTQPVMFEGDAKRPVRVIFGGRYMPSGDVSRS